MPGVVKCPSLAASPENSPPPQLIDTSRAPAIELATSTAWKRSANELLLASTSTIFALGAIACAHSMSSAASCAQPQLVFGFEPLAKTFLKHPFTVVHGGSPSWVEKTFRSFSAVG